MNYYEFGVIQQVADRTKFDLSLALYVTGSRALQISRCFSLPISQPRTIRCGLPSLQSPRSTLIRVISCLSLEIHAISGDQYVLACA